MTDLDAIQLDLAAPVRLEEVDISQPIIDFEPRVSAEGEEYALADVLVRWRGLPIGQVTVSLVGGGVSAQELVSTLNHELADELREIANRDGLPSAVITARGWTATSTEPVEPDTVPPTTIVIPTRGRPDLVTRCVDSVLASEGGLQARVIVVDNAPPDDATQVAVARCFENDGRVTYLRCDTPGSAAARNAGIRASSTPVVMVIDDDVIVDRMWLREMHRGFDAGPRVACVTGAILPLELETPSQRLIEEYGGFHKGFELKLHDVRSRPSPHPLHPYNAGTFGSGGNVAFRRAVLEELGGYDPVLGNGTPTQSGEDFELFLRIVRSGHQLAYQPTAMVRHLHRRHIASLENVVYGYGVGLSAVMARTVHRDPGALLEIMRRIPAALTYLLASSSDKNAKRTVSYPRSLKLTEVAGLARGPFAYAISLRRNRGRATNQILPAGEAV